MQSHRHACAVASLALILGGPAATAQGAVRVSPARVQVEIPIDRSTHESWRWNETATPDERAEYVWSAQLPGDSTYSIGFWLFKAPGAAPREGTFAELLRAGQSNVAEVIGHRERAVPEALLELRAQDSVLVLELRDRALIAKMFARRPDEVTFHMQSPYSELTTRKVRVSYDDVR